MLFQGRVPEICDCCSAPIQNVFYDAKTKRGPWAYMCHPCQVHGEGVNKLGLGLGQKYEKRPDGKFEKTAG